MGEFVMAYNEHYGKVCIHPTLTHMTKILLISFLCIKIQVPRKDSVFGTYTLYQKSPSLHSGHLSLFWPLIEDTAYFCSLCSFSTYLNASWASCGSFLPQLPHASVSYVNTANPDTLPQHRKLSPHPCMSFLSSPLFLCQTGSCAVQAALYVGEDNFTSSWLLSHLPNARIKDILPNLVLVFLLTFQRSRLCLSSPLSSMHSEPHSSCWVGIWWFKCSPWCSRSKPLRVYEPCVPIFWSSLQSQVS